MRHRAAEPQRGSLAVIAKLDLEVGVGSRGNAQQAPPHDVPGVPGRERQHRSGLVGLEAAQAGNAGGDRDGEIEGREGFAALGLAADDADSLAALPFPFQ